MSGVDSSTINFTENELITPVLFLIFNQPKITFRTFEEIRKAKPKRLFVSADGPRETSLVKQKSVR